MINALSNVFSIRRKRKAMLRAADTIAHSGYTLTHEEWGVVDKIEQKLKDREKAEAIRAITELSSQEILENAATIARIARF